MWFLLLIAASAPGYSPKDVTVAQIDVAVAKKRAEAPQQVPSKKDDPRKIVNVNQLPPDLQQSDDAKEGDLVSTSTPEASLTADVLRAWNQIRQRGQTPTPDLVAREIGPDKLAEFLATSPAAASILATGTLPDTKNGSTLPKGRNPGGS